MPQASAEVRAKMQEFFGDPVSDTGPVNFLTDQGYTLEGNWSWTPPSHIKGYEDMTEKEWLCLQFLVHEWDYGKLNLKEKD